MPHTCNPSASLVGIDASGGGSQVKTVAITLIRSADDMGTAACSPCGGPGTQPPPPTTSRAATV